MENQYLRETRLKTKLSRDIHMTALKLLGTIRCMNKNNFSILNLFFSLTMFFYGSCGLMSAGTHGEIKCYDFDYSKPAVNDAIKRVLTEAPQYNVPDVYYNYTWHYGGDSTIKDEWIQGANADSIKFNFYFPDENIIMWCSFVGGADEWYRSSCTLSLIGYVKPNQTKWRFDKEMSSKEREEITSKFEGQILNRLSNELKNNPSSM